MDKQNEAEKQNTTSPGYCSPPKHTRFKPGQSGNTRGRPKGTLNVATVLERTLREKVVVSKDGQRKNLTKLEAAIEQLANKAAAGELKAVQLLAALLRSAEERPVQASVTSSALDHDDEKVLLQILSRLEAAMKGD